MTETVYSEIKLIEEKKQNNRIVPYHATLIELKISLENRCTIEHIKTSLRQLLNDKRILAGRTINDTFIKIAD